MRIKYAFDPAKEAVNRAKHGVSLALAEILFSEPHISITDDRFEYGETRQLAFGFIQNRLFVCVYADQKEKRRIISLRRANKREVKRYAPDIK